MVVMLPEHDAGVIISVILPDGESVDQNVIVDRPTVELKQRLCASGVETGVGVVPVVSCRLLLGGIEIPSSDTLREHAVEAGAVLHANFTKGFKVFYCPSRYVYENHVDLEAQHVPVDAERRDAGTTHVEYEVEVWAEELVEDILNKLVIQEKTAGCCLYQPGFVWFSYSPGEVERTPLSTSSDMTIEAAGIKQGSRLICERKHRGNTARPLNDVDVPPQLSRCQCAPQTYINGRGSLRGRGRPLSLRVGGGGYDVVAKKAGPC